MSDPPKLTDEEHVARAMVMGLHYHHGNGEPFYYEADEFGIPLVNTMLDANTLEPFANKFGMYKKIVQGYMYGRVKEKRNLK